MNKQYTHSEQDNEGDRDNDDVVQRTEHNINTQGLYSLKDMISINSSSRKNNIYNQTVQSASESPSIQSELNQFRLKFKSSSQLKLNNYKDSLEKKILLLKEKIATSHRTTQSVSSQPLCQLSLFLHTLKNNNSICLKVLEFFTPNDLYHFLSIKELHQIILSTIKDAISKRLRLQYETKYSQLFNSNKFILCIQHYKKNKKMNSRIYINIQSDIAVSSNKFYKAKEYVNKTVYMKYVTEFSQKQNKISNVFAFDIYPKGTLNNYWIFKEYTSFHYDDYEKAYYSNLIAFNQGDTMKVTINLFSENGLVNLNTFHWSRLVTKPTLNTNWLMSLISTTKKDNSFSLRYCEVEELRNDWRDISQMENAASFVKSIQMKFDEDFEVKNILFDDVGYYLFKISLTAKRKGIIEASKDIGMNIEIFDHDSSIQNFVKKNDLIIDENNELNLRVGDLLVFYLSHKK